VPGCLCKITPPGRQVFMLQYRTNAGERRNPVLGLFGELTVELTEAWRNMPVSGILESRDDAHPQAEGLCTVAGG